MTLYDIRTSIGELKDVLEKMTARLKGVEECVVRMEALLQERNDQAVSTRAPLEHTPSAQAVLKESLQLERELPARAGTHQPHKAQDVMAAELPGEPDYGEPHMGQKAPASKTAQSSAPTPSLASPTDASVGYPDMQQCTSRRIYPLFMLSADG
jgi:hypothetical protein